eukprot:CAMPEP_0181070876 /NCGR_PEP_ID=MMETSP1070-20121207/27719_1 /TAXON_ID=265543 /ORGANISM="Minutocellus polymorphus, Strain NH13" /LENGTH=135 /DNA_ID=CAMNT_0023151789 /DNA_START=163 /DNA_END=567 /DNA_ORIENTATION=+
MSNCIGHQMSVSHFQHTTCCVHKPYQQAHACNPAHLQHQTHQLTRQPTDTYRSIPTPRTKPYSPSPRDGGATAVSVIRLTGPRSHDALRALLVKPGQSLADVKMPKNRMASLRTLWDPTSSSNVDIFNDDAEDGQ